MGNVVVQRSLQVAILQPATHKKPPILISTIRADMEPARNEIRDGMRIDWDVPIQMDDGIVLRADIFRPVVERRHPVILSYGPYAKGLSFQEGYKGNWARLIEAAPEVLVGSTNKHQNWELVDPEKWVPDGYACVRVDSRGAGGSPGILDVWSPRETQDLYQCIEWAGTQPWSNGKVGINGISYYAMNQWNVGALKPPHLAAMCIWEGSSDYYRELCRHGGILSDFLNSWHPRQVASVQHGVGTRGARSVVTGEWVAGPETLSGEELGKNSADTPSEAKWRRMLDEYYAERTAEFENIEAPLLSAGNWGGMGLHTRGNFEGWLRAGSRQKWLEVHGDTHFTHFYSTYGEALQKRFFGHFIKGEDTGWTRQPRVVLQVRHPAERFVERHEREWPLARTKWTKLYLDPSDQALARAPVARRAAVSYDGFGEGATFLTPPLPRETEITGPIAAKLFVSSQTTDADLFLIVRVLTPNMKEVVFQGALDPHTPIARGWLRASHRKLDPKLSVPYRPYHTHDEKEPLTPGKIYELDVEIWPTSIVAPAGYRIGLTVRGRDYEYPGGPSTGLGTLGAVFTGVGPFQHNDPRDRPPEIFGKKVTIHGGPARRSHVLLPIIPPRAAPTTKERRR